MLEEQGNAGAKRFRARLGKARTKALALEEINDGKRGRARSVAACRCVRGRNGI